MDASFKEYWLASILLEGGRRDISAPFIEDCFRVLVIALSIAFIVMGNIGLGVEGHTRRLPSY